MDLNSEPGSAFSKEQVQILLQGLSVLEGALQAIDQPIPDPLRDLQGILKAELSSISALGNSTLSTEQVASVLGCSTKRVHQLAAKGMIKVIHRGKKGRGNSSLFGTESVRAFKSSKKSKTEP